MSKSDDEQNGDKKIRNKMIREVLGWAHLKSLNN